MLDLSTELRDAHFHLIQFCLNLSLKRILLLGSRVDLGRCACRMSGTGTNALRSGFGSARSISVIFSLRMPGTSHANPPVEQSEQRLRHRHGDAIARPFGSNQYCSGSSLPATRNRSG